MRAAVALRCGMTEAEARRERSREEGITRNVAGSRDGVILRVVEVSSVVVFQMRRCGNCEAEPKWRGKSVPNLTEQQHRSRTRSMGHET